MTASINGTTGVTFPDNSVQNTAANGFGFKNRLINGDFRVQQRSTPTLTNLPQYGVDRWCGSVSGGTSVSGTFGRASFTGSSSGYGASINGSYTSGQPYWYQRIEAMNCADLNSKQITISGLFFQDTGSSQNFNVRVQKANALDDFSATTVVATSSNIAAANNTVVPFSVTFTLGASDATNGLMLEIYASSAVTVTSKNFAIADVQLEKGNTKTDFDTRDIGREELLCKRYYAKMSAGTGIYTGFGIGYQTSTTEAYFFVKYPITMRATPTFSQSNCAVNDTNSFTAAATLGNSWAGTDSARIYQTFSPAGGSANRPVDFLANATTSAFFAMSAEL